MTRPAAPAVIRAATEADLDAVAVIRAARDGGTPALYRPIFEAILTRDPSDDFLLVAACAASDCAVSACCDDVVGYGRAGRNTPRPEAPADTAPAGHYLFGVGVREDHRRRGIGLALTEARIARLRAWTDRVLYFANAGNVASLALHEQLGFIELTREFSYPGLTFEGGEGVLCKLDFPPKHDNAPRRR